MTIERFAPSPTGLLHLGHAYSALTAFQAARAVDGEFLLRIEDIDQPRCKPEFVEAIKEDLTWLGIQWKKPVMVQSDRLPAYDAALRDLRDKGLTYPCSCSRRDVAFALSAPQEGEDPTIGPDGVIYPGTCRHRGMADRQDGDAIRLNMTAAIASIKDFDELGFAEIGLEAGWKTLNAAYLIENCGDIVLARKDIGTSYHVAVVVDDAAQSITHVTRGFDMAPATPIHCLLQHLLRLPRPTYRHHRLIRDNHGQRLAKRHDALAIRTLREQGKSPQDVRDLVRIHD